MKKITVIVSIILVSILAAVIFNYFYNQKVMITESDPKNLSTNIKIDKNYFLLRFNKKQKIEEIKKTKIQPDVNGSWEILEDGFVAKYTLNEYLDNYKDYVITLKIKNYLGKTFSENINFQTEYIEFNLLPIEIRKKELNKTDRCTQEVQDRDLCDE